MGATSEKSRTLFRILNLNFVKRLILGSAMLISFVFLCQHSTSYIILFTIALSVGICYELISIVKEKNRPFSLHYALIIYLSIVIYSSQVLPALTDYYPWLTAYRIIAKHRTIAFYLYTLGLMATVYNLRKSRVSSQLLLFAVIHLFVPVIGMATAYSIHNLMYGSFYYFYPAILVITNDISAYFIGKTFGRRQLYELSPKKTIEGFLGASLVTFMVSFFLMNLKIRHGFLPDSLDSALNLPASSNVWFLNFPLAYIHAVSFGFFASFVAPFIGFLASAIKRAFRKKDFGDMIPGHGGITDRMDCQLLMVFITQYYVNAFIENMEIVERY